MNSELLIITAGRGPLECNLVVSKVAKKLQQEAQENKINFSILESSALDKNGNPASLIIKLTGKELSSFISSWIGSIKWIMTSPYRVHHKRKNWYVSIAKISLPHIEQINIDDIEISYTRASGPGGQNINKSHSAVIIKHIPTGITIRSQCQREQKQNKKDALKRLQQALMAKNKQANEQISYLNWIQHNQVIRGGEIRTFKD